MAVLDARMEAHAVATAAQLGVERRDDRVALRAREVAGREVDHHRRFVVGDGHEVAAVRDLVGPSSTPMAAASIGARPVW